MRSSSPSRSIVVAMVVIGFVTFLSATHSWGGYHWARTQNPFTLKTGNNVTSDWAPYLDEMILQWSLSSVLDLTKVAGGTTGIKCRPTAGRIEVCSAKYGNNGWLGLAQIWLNGLHITQATAKMNDTYFSTRTYNTQWWRRLVMCQEIAHDFGLDHQDENFSNKNLGTCMDYTRNPLGPPSNEYPNRHDFEELVTIYTHLDSTTTVGNSRLPSSMPPAMGDIDFETPAQWGKIKRSSPDGRVQDYELDFGGGHQVITHVVWADPDGDEKDGKGKDDKGKR